MRQYLVSAFTAIAALVLSPSAQAQGVSQDIQLEAEVLSYCTIGGSATTSPVGPYNIPVDAAGVVDQTQIVVTPIANVACNTSAYIDTESVFGGVTTGGAAPTGATNVIHYTAVASFGGASSTLDTSVSSNGSQGTTPNAATGSLTVTVTPDQPALPLAPGSYADTLRVTLTPTP